MDIERMLYTKKTNLNYIVQYLFTVIYEKI